MDNFNDAFPDIPQRISGLKELAYNLWWSWHPEARMLFKMLSRAAWKLSVHNPVKMLNDVSRETFETAAKDPKFLRHYDAVMARFRSDMSPSGDWFSSRIADARLLPIAYFSAEYGLHHSLPFYAGGLGFLSGDFLKECSDLGVPIVAMGFMYPEGYLRQKISPDGWQSAESERIDRENAPITRILDSDGNRLTVKVPFIEPPIYVEVWKVQVGKVTLYLMDTDIDANDPWNRNITSHLYVGGYEQRLRQEIVLGIGGTEVLSALGIKHSILHLNEGHPAFAVLERIREKVGAGLSFEEAFEKVRATTIFTTHTPVPAGHDVFPFELIEKYFTSYWPSLGICCDAFFNLGVDPKFPNAGFNMTAFALKASAYHNAVSKKHSEVAKKMWQPLWPDLPEESVPIAHITNGVHVPTWIEPRTELLYNRYLGPYWLADHDNPDIWNLVDDIPDRELWNNHYWHKMKLILQIMNRARQRWLEAPEPRVILASGVLLDPNVLTIGFARRFTTYKRAALIFHDAERLRKILTNRWNPVQIIFAGKAHPADEPGRQMLQKVFNASKDPYFGGRIAFVEDYDEQLAQYLVHGVDVWLNNPLPPLEACGTSGMKASLNGVPHLSILDGWWSEGFNGKNGWAVDSHEWDNGDSLDAQSLYDILETQVVPIYYRTDDYGVPHDWVRVMKEAIKSTAPVFSARRMTKEYAAHFYSEALKSVSGETRPAI
ncbi:MAG TPA: alpha-glucan family phosphorylase [Candidatus Sulfobium mesophilum]|nr:alpha-glucan family phosphorylase [Candidatus Sulfobium mesophilum]